MRCRAGPETYKTTFCQAHIRSGARPRRRAKNLQTRFSLERSLARTCESTRSPERSPRTFGALSGRLSGGQYAHAAAHTPTNPCDRAAQVGHRASAWSRSSCPPFPREASSPDAAAAAPCERPPDETTEKNIVRITKSAVTNQKQQRASGRGCPDARWRGFAAPSGPVSGGCYSAVIEAEALVLAVAESPAEALERGHSMRCLMMRRLSA